jgi:hypothetical protein
VQQSGDEDVNMELKSGSSSKGDLAMALAFISRDDEPLALLHLAPLKPLASSACDEHLDERILTKFQDQGEVCARLLAFTAGPNADQIMAAEGNEPAPAIQLILRSSPDLKPLFVKFFPKLGWTGETPVGGSV